ncbi:MAG: hypothetical protein UY20_C0017G0010 [Candidatus Yanofskybacteria bacterium GW2011_GWA1_48_10]|uniref:Uncharacterized protein n=1 Tax=Candidatus Yanofskybacteria bacterium GW2011_GWA1_48_10 TaxID=1619022 RepID=A0A0G1U4S1_9BACT|nr:MAG: hypothetical protein UY20_C0017G0010 [Candidatus Yanofskybacteria bacterium GW2011_GWA1_48_10]
MPPKGELDPRNALHHLLTHRPDGITAEADPYDGLTIDVYNEDAGRRFSFVSRNRRTDNLDVFSLEVRNMSGGWSSIISVFCEPDGTSTIQFEAIALHYLYPSEIVQYKSGSVRETIGWHGRSRGSTSLEQDRLAMEDAGHLHIRQCPMILDTDATAQRFFEQIARGDFSTPLIFPDTAPQPAGSMDP